MSRLPYKTFIRRGEAEFVVNKSRFIGHGAPCEDEEQALAFLKETRAKYKDASHNCYAYITSINMGVMRYSDDGEPGGTAGLPIIEVLKGQALTNCCVVVTRYFGGVLLGTGGLVRAYTQGAQAALGACGVGTMHPSARYLLDVSYPMLGKVEYFLKDARVKLEDKTFAETVTITLLVRVADEAAFVGQLTEITEGRVSPLRFEEIYEAWPE